ncbi:hypothetical protein ACLKA6_009442 [Drosophila palustris]
MKSLFSNRALELSLFVAPTVSLQLLLLAKLGCQLGFQFVGCRQSSRHQMEMEMEKGGKMKGSWGRELKSEVALTLACIAPNWWHREIVAGSSTCWRRTRRGPVKSHRRQCTETSWQHRPRRQR